MRRNTKVRDRNGLIRVVGDNYVLQNGEALVVEQRLMDANGRTLIHDGHGNPAGQRPGFLYSDENKRAEGDLAAAYVAYDQAITNRWRQQSNQAESTPPASFDTLEQALAAAYADYEQRIRGAWRK